MLCGYWNPQDRSFGGTAEAYLTATSHFFAGVHIPITLLYLCTVIPMKLDLAQISNHITDQYTPLVSGLLD